MISPTLALWLSGVLAGLGLALLPAAFRAIARALRPTRYPLPATRYSR